MSRPETECLLNGCEEDKSRLRPDDPEVSDFCAIHLKWAGVPCRTCKRWSPSVKCAYAKVGRCQKSDPDQAKATDPR